MDDNRMDQDNGFVPAGLLVALFGLFFVGLSIWGSGEGFNAPRWVVAAAGGVFFLAGLSIFGQRYRFFNGFAVASLVTLLGAVITWVSFGPGERQFSSSISIPFLSISGPSSELSGRICFAPGAILIDGMAVYLWFRLFRDWLLRDFFED
jgi:hypothetical protein